MVVVTEREPDSRRPDGAMSSSDAEDDFLEPATPTATQAGHALPLLPQEVPGLGWETGGGGGDGAQREKQVLGGADLEMLALLGLRVRSQAEGGARGAVLTCPPPAPQSPTNAPGVSSLP